MINPFDGRHSCEDVGLLLAAGPDGSLECYDDQVDRLSVLLGFLLEAGDPAGQSHLAIIKTWGVVNLVLEVFGGEFVVADILSDSIGAVTGNKICCTS